jgi:hypothetical protein
LGSSFEPEYMLAAVPAAVYGLALIKLPAFSTEAPWPIDEIRSGVLIALKDFGAVAVGLYGTPWPSMYEGPDGTGAGGGVVIGTFVLVTGSHWKFSAPVPPGIDEGAIVGGGVTAGATPAGWVAILAITSVSAATAD